MAARETRHGSGGDSETPDPVKSPFRYSIPSELMMSASSSASSGKYFVPSPALAAGWQCGVADACVWRSGQHEQSVVGVASAAAGFVILLVMLFGWLARSFVKVKGGCTARTSIPRSAGA